MHVTVNSLASWSPVDQNVAEKKGGLVRLLSTHENKAQMNCSLFTIKKFAQDNRGLIGALLKANFSASDRLKVLVLLTI